MKGDFSRNTFDPINHFSRVLMQQGRAQLDSDWNEQASILLHYLQTLAADLIGPHGGPDTHVGFGISGDPALTNDFFIGPGRYYVDGILCELDPGVLRIDSASGTTLTVPSVTLDNRQLVANDWIEIEIEIADNQGKWHKAQISWIDPNKRTLTVKGTPPANPIQLRRLTTYQNQPDYPGSRIDKDGTYLVYLDVWERHVTAIEDGSIREVALGGPDTATRAKVVWQVKVTATRPDDTAITAITCDDMKKQWPTWVDAWRAQSACQLRVRLKPGQVNADPCTIAPTSAYRGQENQLYRVEIHAGGNLKQKPQPTFKWSRDNGSIAAAWVGNNDDGAMLVSNTHGFDAKQWIEITSEEQDLLGQPGEFVKIVKVEGGALYLETPQAWDKNTPKKVRRWDQTKTEEIQLPDGVVPIKEGTTEADWIDLEDGLQVQFQPGGHYRTGDYWLIPARTAGTIEWPVEVGADGRPAPDASGHPIPIAQSPHGITHHYAPLWFISVANSTVTAVPAGDLRCKLHTAATCAK